MALEELQDWSSVTRGCASRSFFVRFLYASKALLMINWKLDDEEAIGARNMKGRAKKNLVRRREDDGGSEVMGQRKTVCWAQPH